MRLSTDQQQTVILVTHDPGIAAAAGRTIQMRDGRIEADRRNGTVGNAVAPTVPP
jgi:ABC-type lipoprotein export system ATPase subunit